MGFVLFAYPWGEPGSSLDGFPGPDVWQAEFLNDLGAEVKKRTFDGKNAVAPIRMAVGSGHGIGKSTLVAWLVDWIMSTRPGCQGTVTANTFTQLSTKTWAAIQRWTGMCITSHWFNITDDRMYRTAQPKSWFCTPQTCKEENSEAFAGQHALQSSSFYICDEASSVPDKIFEVAEGGMTDGEPMIFLFGNPTRSTGKFHRVCFGEERERWNSRSIDSRHCAFTNKKEIAEWEYEYGEDSDFFRVRVRGVPPRASDLQFIDSERISNAENRDVHVMVDEPLVLGIDLARGGEDSNVLSFRRGLDARTIPSMRIKGQDARDSMFMVTKIMDVVELYKPAAVFLDATGGSIGGPIGDRLRQMGFQVVDVQFGGQAPDGKYANMRSWMWSKMRDWLGQGAIEKDYRLSTDLSGPIAGHNKRDKLILESKESMKKRGLHSPDDGDALALTFAQPVGPTRRPRKHKPRLVGVFS